MTGLGEVNKGRAAEEVAVEIARVPGELSLEERKWPRHNLQYEATWGRGYAEAARGARRAQPTFVLMGAVQRRTILRRGQVAGCAGCVHLPGSR